MLKRVESGISARSLGFDYLIGVKKYAIQLDLKGVVFTKNDGSIKVIAEGEDENLVKLTKKLERGNHFTPVENFYANWNEVNGEFRDFSIKM